MTKITRILILSVIVLCLYQGGGVSFAQSSSVFNGLSYLQSTQSPDGYWGETTEVGYNTIVDTCAAADTLKYINETVSSYSLALQWVNITATSNNDYLAAKIVTLANGGLDSTSFLNTLLSLQNTDGGWGADAGFESDVKRTALTLLALKAANYSDQTVINNAITYLLSNQNTDGGFGFYFGDGSNVYMTAAVSSTLQQFQQTTSIATAVNKATSYIISHQQADGSWGTIYETAHAYIALISVSTDATVLGNAINYIATTQSTNGSWNDDPYSSALAIRALYLSENKPTPPPPAPTTGTVTGKVVDSSTNQPISGVSVSLVDSSAITTITDVNGEFSLSNIPEGSIQINIAMPGYTSILKTIEIIAGETIGLGTISLIQNAATGRIAGTIYSIGGQPIPGVTVEVTGATTLSTTTDSNGSYNLTDVPPGEITITASKGGYHPVSGTGNLSGGGVLYFSPALLPLEFPLPPTSTGTLKGTVIDPTSTTLQGVTVTLTSLPTLQDMYVLYVSSLGEGKVIRITPTGETSVVVEGFAFNELDNGIVLDEAGNLYLENFASGRIVKVTPAGEVSIVVEGYGYGMVGQLAFDSQENLYFGQRSGSHVYKVTPDGTVSVYASGFGGAAGIAFDKADNLYVTNEGRGTVSKVIPSGEVSTFATGIPNPYTLALDSKDNLYVLSVYSGNLYKVNPNGEVSLFLQGTDESHGLVIDKDDNIYISRYYQKAIIKVTPDGVVSTFFSNTPDRPTGLYVAQQPETITLPPAMTDINGEFIISDIPAGSYKVTIDAPGYEPQTFDVVIPEGGTVILPTIILTPVPTATLALSTEQVSYPANADITINATVTNISDDTLDLTLGLRIEDRVTGEIVSILPSISISGLAGGEVRNITTNWNTGTTLSGDYSVKSIIVFGNNYTVTEGSADFSILPDETIMVQVTTDKIAYSSNESITLTSTVTSQSPNTILTGLEASVDVADSQGAVIFTETKTLSDLMPEARIEFKSFTNTGTHPAGIYTANLKIKSNGELLTSASTTFEILSSLTQAKALAGTISANPGAIFEKETTTLSYTIQNIGNDIDLPLIQTEIIIVDPDTELPVRTITGETSLNDREVYANDIIFDSTGLSASGGPKPYLIVLRATTADLTQTLNSAGLIINPIPNNAPIANAGPDQFAFAGQPVLLDGSASSDPDGDPLSFTWHFTLVPNASQTTDNSLSNSMMPTPSFVPDADGIYTLSLVVNDGLADSQTDTVSVFVNPPASVDIHPETINLKSNGGSKSITGVLTSPVLSSFEFFTAEVGITITANFTLENRYMDKDGNEVVFTIPAEDYPGDDKVEQVDADGDGNIDLYQLTLKFNRDQLIAGFKDANGNLRIVQATELTSTVIGNGIRVGSDVNTVILPPEVKK